MKRPQPKKIAIRVIGRAVRIQVKVFSRVKSAMSFEFTKMQPHRLEPIGGSKRADAILAFNITMAIIVVIGVVIMFVMRPGA